jgi:undecaprenyl-diphosphatase
MLQRINELDRELFLYLNNLGNENWDTFWLLVTDKWTAIPLYIILLYILFKKFGWKGFLLSLVVITLLITATDQLGNVFKDGFRRLRPCGQEGVMEYARCSQTLWQVRLFFCTRFQFNGGCNFSGDHP